jgi:hypothetical protein
MLSGWLVATRPKILHMRVYRIPSRDFIVAGEQYLAAETCQHDLTLLGILGAREAVPSLMLTISTFGRGHVPILPNIPLL